jgi:Histone-like transcription factor (CBF/NF-Y) and archaeal histone
MQPTSTMASADEPTLTTSKVERAAGTTFLPIARVKRIIKEDKDVSLINAEATFCVAYATVCIYIWRLQCSLAFRP